MQIVLFIGHHKVGSTSLQDYLSRNYSALAKAGILYPMVEMEGLSLMMSQAVLGTKPKGPLPINAREAHNALAFRMIAETSNDRHVPHYHKGLPHSKQMFRAIKQQVECFKPKAVILAAEVFANFSAVSPALIERIQTEFPDAKIRVICTLRQIDEYLMSWHGQRLKFGERIRPLRDGALQNYYKSIHFDYKRMLSGWVDMLPDADIILRDYSEVLASGGSIEDFTITSGLRFPKGLTPPSRSNPSLHRAMIEIARLANATLPPKSSNAVRHFLDAVTPELKLPQPIDIEMFGAADRQEMCEKFEPIHAYISDLSQRTPFFEDAEKMRETRPIPELEAAAVALAAVKTRIRSVKDPDAHAFLKDLEIKAEA